MHWCQLGVPGLEKGGLTVCQDNVSRQRAYDAQRGGLAEISDKHPQAKLSIPPQPNASTNP
jgi:hypothetical protein